MLQVTPAMAESFATVAVKACVPPPLSDTLAGLTLTLMESTTGGVSVMVAVPDFVASVTLVAVSVRVVVALTVAGAV
jgi:hypothetical protein